MADPEGGTEQDDVSFLRTVSYFVHLNKRSVRLFCFF